VSSPKNNHPRPWVAKLRAEVESTPRKMFFPIMSQPQPQVMVQQINFQISPMLEKLRNIEADDRANLIEVLIYAHNVHSRLDEAVDQCEVQFSESFPKLDLGFSLSKTETFLLIHLLAGDNLNDKPPEGGEGR